MIILKPPQTIPLLPTSSLQNLVDISYYNTQLSYLVISKVESIVLRKHRDDLILAHIVLSGKPEDKIKLQSICQLLYDLNTRFCYYKINMVT